MEVNAGLDLLHVHCRGYLASSILLSLIPFILDVFVFLAYFILHFQARKDNRRLIRVSMLISVRGIKMSDMETGKTLLNFSIYR